MRVGLDTFKQLLPSGKAWRLTIDRQLRQFFEGLSVEPGDAQDYQDGVWNDYRPQPTSKLSEWEDQFGLISTGLTEQERRDRLAATWKAQGGQSPRYLQDTVQNAGFPLYIHEWWWPGITPPIVRDPRSWISVDGTGFRVVTRLGEPETILGEPSARLGTSEPLGDLIEDNLREPVVIPSDPDTWPYFLYFGGQVFGESVQIPIERRQELDTLLLKLCPAQQWVGIFVEYV